MNYTFLHVQDNPMNISSLTTRLVLTLLLVLLPLAHLHAKSLRVESDWLSANLQQAKLLIIDVRAKADYLQGHIPGAVNFPDNLSYQNKSQSGHIVKPDSASKLFRSLGMDTDNKLVIYDEGSMTKSARVLWMLEVYNFSDVKILNGGFGAWQEKNFPVSKEIPDITPSQYVVQIDNNKIASKFSTQLATINPHQVVIDARPQAAYQGKTSSAKRYGHIPSAVNIPVHDNFNTDTSTDNIKFLLDEQKLSKLYSDINKDNKVIIYCEAGTVSSTNYLVLRELGYNVSNYDASWREWGNDFNLPIEN